jgi:outer membrane immunogenic protein
VVGSVVLPRRNLRSGQVFLSGLGKEVVMLRVAVFGLALAAFATGASAADLITYQTSTKQQVPVAPTGSTVDWNGFYAGIYGVGRGTATQGAQYGAGVDLGVNATFNFVLVGAEVSVEGLGDGAGSTSYAEAIGRGGILLGGNTLLYGAAGYGIDTGTPDETDVLAGGGLEYALTNSVSLRAQYLHAFPVTGNDPKDEVTLGAQFHF